MLQTRTQVLPNFFIIGAAKCGTTALCRYLDAHPEVCMSQPKEPGVFGAADWEQRLGDYAEMFSAPEAPVRGDASTRYTTYPVIQGIPDRVAAHCPDARLIYMVRDPVDRLVASWVQGYASMSEHRTLRAVLNDLDQPANRFVAASRYATQLEQWLRRFDREQILVVDQAAPREDREAVVLDALRHLEVTPQVPKGIAAEFNVTEAKERMTPSAARLWYTFQPLTRRLPARFGTYLASSRMFPVEKVGRPALSDELRRRLEDELRDEMVRFRELTGMKFASWSI